MKVAIWGPAAIVSLALTPVPALAFQDRDSSALQAEISRLQQGEAIANERIRLLEQRLQLLEEMIGTARAQAQAPPPQRVQPQQPAAAPQQQAAASEEPQRRAPAPSEAVETVARAEQGTYGRRFSLEPGISYSHTTSAALNLSGFLALDAIFLGRFSIDEIDSDIVTADLTARYGLTDRLQVDVNVPYLLRHSTYTSGGAGGSAEGLSQASVDKRGFGDVSAGISYRVLKETPRRPDIVFSGRVKAPTGDDPFGISLVEIEGSNGNLAVPKELPTGTGVWAASIGVSALKTIDPLVVFGNGTFFYNFEGDFKDLDENEGLQPGKARLGNAIQFGAGMAIALNDTSSLALSFTQRFVRTSRVKGLDEEKFRDVVGSDANVGLLNVGASFALSDRIALLANVSAGITDDAPDMQIGLRLPIRF